MYFDLVLVSVDFRELVSNGKLLGWMTLASHLGEYFGKTLVLEQSGAGCLVGIVDYTSVYVAHVAVPAEKLWFLGKSK